MTLYAYLLIHCFLFDGTIICDIPINSMIMDPPRTYTTEAECREAANWRVQWRGGPDTGFVRALCFKVTAAKVPAP